MVERQVIEPRLRAEVLGWRLGYEPIRRAEWKLLVRCGVYS